jgi:hypothetical protein
MDGKTGGCDPCHGRLASQTGLSGRTVVRAVQTSDTSALGREAAQSRALAGSSLEQRLANMYRNNADGLRQHFEMLGSSSCPSASANMALYPSSRTEGSN